MLPRGAGILSLAIKDKAQLYVSYMPFIKGGALFVPSTRQTRLGDEIFVVVTLPDDPEKLPITGKVVWVNHRNQGQRPAGFGIQLSGEAGDSCRRKIEAQLGGALQADRPTFTM
ncbi:type IV pilus assembly protein PilZ [Fluviicoccus keumensis]|uniref:Type IV pilus assembly protein PilZ n=1 Tax=Fluviicoccus keumensis TaxID=1435465 RepID=A0A4V2G3I7_9GAMM|nr:PilZ domain-containing protein [Fluviicoccus keumensis]RZU37136.1 type IV pilus assembly protein PilZ [Fluviicoccus keumensis]